MNDAARLVLRDVIRKHGPALIDNPRLLKSALSDECGNRHQSCRLEIRLLTQAAELNLPAEMQASTDGLLLIRLKPMADRMSGELGTASDLALWAVESWALALGAVTESELRATKQAAHAPPPQSSTAPRSGPGMSPPPTATVPPGPQAAPRSAWQASPAGSTGPAGPAGPTGPAIPTAPPGLAPPRRSSPVGGIAVGVAALGAILFVSINGLHSLGTSNQASGQITTPSQVTVKMCRRSHKLAGPNCPAGDVVETQVPAGTVTDTCDYPHTQSPQPPQRDPVPTQTHLVTVCSTTGKKAGNGCPSTQERSFPVGGDPLLCSSHPQPTLTIDNCPTSASRGSTFYVTVTVVNRGQPTQLGSVTLSTPQPARVLYLASAPWEPNHWEPGAKTAAYDSAEANLVNGNHVSSEYGAEAYGRHVWGTGRSHTLRFAVTPASSGSMTLQLRCTLDIGKDPSLRSRLGQRFFSDPPMRNLGSITRGDQNFPVYTRTVFVN